jgi:N-hydroxyarylamine O-acetyltransferase
LDDFEFVDGYLDRIELPLIPSVDADSLMLLQTNHLRHVPYENLDILEGDVPLNLDVDYLWDKIVRRKRGGICYEQNILFAAVLEKLGFKVRRMAAHDPLLGANEFDHMFLLVDFPMLEETWVSDVGFEDNFFAPIKFRSDTWQSDLRDMLKVDSMGHGVYDLVRRNSIGDEDALYEFNLSQHSDADYKPRCDYFATDPRSPLKRGPVISIDAPGGRKHLTRDKFRHFIDGEEFSVDVRNQEHFDLLLRDEFGLER